MKRRKLTLVIVGLMILATSFFPARSIVTASGELEGIKVCLDPGHGGSDPGAVNDAFSLRESDINLDVSFGLAMLLETEGAEVVLTRTDDSYLTNEDRYTFCNDAQATILISVHTNSVTDPTWDGTMTLYGPRESPALAETLHNIMFPLLEDSVPAGVELFRDFGVDHFASGVLFKSVMPAAMIEPVLMSHPAEGEVLVQTIFDDPVAGSISAGCADLNCRRGQIAQSVMQGVLGYFADEPTPEPGVAIHVADMHMWSESRGSKQTISTSVLIQDGDGVPVAGVVVDLSTIMPDDTIVYSNAVTNTDGTALFQLRSRLNGTFISTVMDVNRDGREYDPAANIISEYSLEVP